MDESLTIVLVLVLQKKDANQVLVRRCAIVGRIDVVLYWNLILSKAKLAQSQGKCKLLLLRREMSHSHSQIRQVQNLERNLYLSIKLFQLRSIHEILDVFSAFLLYSSTHELQKLEKTVRPS